METYYEMETYLSGRIHTDKNKKPITLIGFFCCIIKITYVCIKIVYMLGYVLILAGVVIMWSLLSDQKNNK